MSPFACPISITGLDQAAAAKSGIQWDILYANILMHEVIYLGYLNYYDDPGATKGTIESNQADSTTLMTLPPYIKKKLDWYFNAPQTCP